MEFMILPFTFGTLEFETTTRREKIGSNFVLGVAANSGLSDDDKGPAEKKVWLEKAGTPPAQTMA